MSFVKPFVAVLIVLVWSVAVLYLVLTGGETGALTYITPPVMLAIGFLLGDELRKAGRAVRNGNGNGGRNGD